MGTDSLPTIEYWLAANRPRYHARLGNGATDDQLDEFETRFSLWLPPAFRGLYRWHNGQPADCLEPFHDNRMFVSLPDMAGIKEELDGMIDTDFDDPRWWRRGWVPFLHNGAGDYLCVDLSAQDGGRPGQLVEFWHNESDRRVVYPSVDAWIDAVAAAMVSGTLNLI